MWKPGVWELVIVLVIVLVIFGAGRLSRLGKDLGEGIREFRRSLGDEGDENKEKTEGTEGKVEE